jgi:hypothetical protein
MSYHQQEALGFIPGIVPALLAPLLYSKAAEVVSGPDEATCRANRDRATASMDAATDETARNWKPTGFYLVTDMAKMRDQVMKLLLDASKACEDAINAGPFTYRSTLRMAQDMVQRKLAESVAFSNAIGTATQRGVRVIDSPSFKRWVVESMTKASVATGHVAYMACIKPFLVTVVEKVYQVSRVIISIAKTMVKVALAIGEQFVKVPDLLAELWKYTKYGALAFAAYYVLKPKRTQNPARRRRRR